MLQTFALGFWSLAKLQLWDIIVHVRRQLLERYWFPLLICEIYNNSFGFLNVGKTTALRCMIQISFGFLIVGKKLQLWDIWYRIALGLWSLPNYPPVRFKIHNCFWFLIIDKKYSCEIWSELLWVPDRWPNECMVLLEMYCVYYKNVLNLKKSTVMYSNPFRVSDVC